MIAKHIYVWFDKTIEKHRISIKINEVRTQFDK